MDNRKKISFFIPLFALLIFVLIIGGAFIVLTNVSNQRKEKVYKVFEKETNTYIQSNKQGLTYLFNNVFKDNGCIVNYAQSRADQSQIAQTVSKDLKDFSSTIFIKMGNCSTILSMRLSGEIERFSLNTPSQEKIVLELLQGRREEVPWDDYTYHLANKEVIIPVKDAQGKVIGALVRGVIE